MGIAKVGAALGLVFTAKLSGESLFEWDGFRPHTLVSAPQNYIPQHLPELQLKVKISNAFELRVWVHKLILVTAWLLTIPWISQLLTTLLAPSSPSAATTNESALLHTPGTKHEFVSRASFSTLECPLTCKGHPLNGYAALLPGEHLLSGGCKVKQAHTPRYRHLQIPFQQLRLQDLPLDLAASLAYLYGSQLKRPKQATSQHYLDALLVRSVSLAWDIFPGSRYRPGAAPKSSLGLITLLETGRKFWFTHTTFPKPENGHDHILKYKCKLLCPLSRYMRGLENCSWSTDFYVSGVLGEEKNV